MLNTEEQVRLKLEASRKELLDLGARNNPLLNYRALRSRGVEVVDELPAEVFRLLVRDGRSMTFLPASEDQELAIQEQSGEAFGPELTSERYTDHKLQTKETAKKLEARLLDTYYTARTYIEEQGVSVLYLALGMLNWYEDETSQELRRSPLILTPVELERSNARERFRLKYTEGDIGSNTTALGWRVPTGNDCHSTKQVGNSES